MVFRYVLVIWEVWVVYIPYNQKCPQTIERLGLQIRRLQRELQLFEVLFPKLHYNLRFMIAFIDLHPHAHFISSLFLPLLSWTYWFPLLLKSIYFFPYLTDSSICNISTIQYIIHYIKHVWNRSAILHLKFVDFSFSALLRLIPAEKTGKVSFYVRYLADCKSF